MMVFHNALPKGVWNIVGTVYHRSKAGRNLLLNISYSWKAIFTQWRIYRWEDHDIQNNESRRLQWCL